MPPPAYARLTKVQRYPQGTSNNEDTCQQENYYYDTNPFDSTFSQYALGRLTAIQYYGGSPAGMQGYCDTTFTEMYSYSQPGAKVAKRLRVYRNNLLWINYPIPGENGSGPGQGDLNSSYTYDNEGRMISVQYPSYGIYSPPTAGPNLGWGYDTMGRLNTMTDLAANSSIVNATTYGPSNEMLSMSGIMTGSWTYNSRLQLTSLYYNGTGGLVNITYAYSASQNNGKITSQTDNISGEQVVYTYDALNRLATATAASGAWGQSYNYDGFGNLTDQNVTAGSAPAYHVVPDPSTNHVGSTDANGNSLFTTGVGYDVSNRLVNGGYFNNVIYSYAPGNKRVWRGNLASGGNGYSVDEVTFWSVTGQKLASYNIVVQPGSGSSTPPSIAFSLNVANYYFGGKLIAHLNSIGTLTGVSADRLGSVGHFYPFGQEKPSATTNGTEKFTGYYRDSETGFDYAINRYHQPGMGRFLTPDPYRGSAIATRPGSWNKYSYTHGDPINRRDGRGLDDFGDDDSLMQGPDGGDSGGGDGVCPDDTLGVLAADAEDCIEPPPPPVPPPPGWTLLLGYTPVLNVPGTGQFDHLFIEIYQDGSSPGDPSDSYVLDGGPQHSCSAGVTLCGNLEADVSVYGMYNEILNPNALDFFDTDLSASSAATLVNDGIHLQSELQFANVTYNPILGPNSNSVVYTLLSEIGVNAPLLSANIQSGPYSIPVGTANVNGGTQVFTGWGQTVP